MSINILFILSTALTAIILGFFAIILWKVIDNTIDLSTLVSEPDSGKASLSRFQMLLFTFVVAGVFMVLSLETGQFVEIPDGVLALIGISSGSYVVSKAVGKKPPTLANPPTPKAVDGAAAPGPADDKLNPKI